MIAPSPSRRSQSSEVSTHHQSESDPADTLTIMSHTLHVVDAFTETPLKGNPAAVSLTKRPEDVVMDLFSRKVVGWAVAPTIRRELVLDAVLKARQARNPRGTLIHSDQGSQFGSEAWRRFYRTNGLEPSMSRPIFGHR
jgi:transposase InsO family protein